MYGAPSLEHVATAPAFVEGPHAYINIETRAIVGDLEPERRGLGRIRNFCVVLGLEHWKLDVMILRSIVE